MPNRIMWCSIAIRKINLLFCILHILPVSTWMGRWIDLIERTFPGIETKFAGSSCNDLVTLDSSGSTIISGHFDKSIRFWDSRSESSSNNIILNGRVTSLDLSRGEFKIIPAVPLDFSVGSWEAIFYAASVIRLTGFWFIYTCKTALKLFLILKGICIGV